MIEQLKTTIRKNKKLPAAVAATALALTPLLNACTSSSEPKHAKGEIKGFQPYNNVLLPFKTEASHPKHLVLRLGLDGAAIIRFVNVHAKMTEESTIPGAPTRGKGITRKILDELDAVQVTVEDDVKPTVSNLECEAVGHIIHEDINFAFKGQEHHVSTYYGYCDPETYQPPANHMIEIQGHNYPVTG